MLKQLLTTFSLFFAVISIAQQPFSNQEFQSKYHMIDSTELYNTNTSKSFVQTTPPIAPVRSVAEWEQSEGVLVSYSGQFGIPLSLIAEMSQDCKVITIVQSSAQQTTVTNQYNTNGVNISNCSFYVAPLNSYWVRDYGPWFIVDGNNNVGIVDFPYDRPRADDDEIPVKIASYLNVPLFGMNLENTGGNYMSNGLGVAASTTLVNDDNPSLSNTQINTLVNDYLGISNFYITADPLGDYIKHIDCWGKFLAVDKVLIASVPVTDSRYADYEAMATFWSNEISSYGNNYQVFRVYEPNGQPYSNSLILNKKVFVPTASGTGSGNNAAAIAIYQHAMPGYEVFSYASTSWVSTDALHCRTHEVADRGMLYIKHLPLLGEKPLQTQYLISADITALSDSSLIQDSIWIKYKVNNSSWNQVSMIHTTGNSWQGNIPQALPGDTIRYYIHASDKSLRSTTHPLIGQPDPHKFWIANSVGVSETTTEKVMVFPNPANNDLYVALRNYSNYNGNVSIYDAFGKLVKETSISEFQGKLVKIDVSDLSAGSYFVSVITGTSVNTSKLMIMH